MGVSTAEVYTRYDSLTDVRHPDVDAQIEAIRRGDLENMAKCCINVLEEVTGAIYPQIGEIERFFEEKGALVSRMSGSGPTVFAIFATQEQAQEAAAAFAEARKEEDCIVFPCRFVYQI